MNAPITAGLTAPQRLRALLAEPGFVVMPASMTAFRPSSVSRQASRGVPFRPCVVASRLGGPDLDLLSFGEMFDSFQMVHGRHRICSCWPTRPQLWQCHERAANGARLSRAGAARC